MEIHKPKPWHGFREFFKEYAIIVLGVLTALALEQAVEGFHWAEIVSHDKRALTEMTEDLYAKQLGRVDQQDCIDHRLADIAVVFKRHAAGAPLGINGSVGRPSYFSEDLSPFQMAIADQSLAHMEPGEKTRFYSVMNADHIFSDTEDKELTAWRTLRTLDDSADFTQADWEDLKKAYRQAEDLNGVMEYHLTSRSADNWLLAFRSFSRPAQKDVSLRMMPWVKQLCSGTIVS